MRLTIAIGAFAGLAACDAGIVTGSGSETATRAATNPAETACVSAVASETGSDQVGVVNSEPRASGTTVTVAVGPQAAPWQCAVSSGGLVVESVTSLTDEGAL